MEDQAEVNSQSPQNSTATRARGYARCLRLEMHIPMDDLAEILERCADELDAVED